MSSPGLPSAAPAWYNISKGRRCFALAEKDLAQKQLAEYEDVFADIVNVLLLGGEPLIKPEELTPANPASTYKGRDSKLRLQERDIAKFWQRGHIHLAFIGLENQTTVSPVMPLRVIGYDGAAYRDALNRMETEEGAGNEVGDGGGKSPLRPYPVITLVLYFNHERRWTVPRTLKECFDIPPQLDRYVNDYKIHVFEIAWLEDETVAKFTSDFRFLADYYVQLRKTNQWQPMSGKARHIKELLELFRALTNDDRFIALYETRKGEQSDMTAKGLDYWFAEVGDKMRAEGEARGIETARTQNALAMFADHVPVDKVAKYSNLTIQEATNIGKQHGYL